MQNSGGGLKFVTAGGSYDIVTSQNKYTVGAVVIRADDISPASIEGGTWTKIAQGRAIIGVSDAYPLGSTGGSADAVVVSHNHKETIYTNGLFGDIIKVIDGVHNAYGFALNITHSEGWGTSAAYTNIFGESGTGKNMMPYIALNIWQKIAD